MQVTFTFDQNDYAFVRDHCPEDHPVLPFVSVVDAFYVTLKKHIGSCVLKDIRLVKGIILPDFQTFELIIEIDEDQKMIQLISKNHVTHYRAVYEKVSSDLPNPSSKNYDVAKEGRSEWKEDYEFLFHGPMLHSIVSIKTDEPDKGAVGVLKTAIGMRWTKTDWFFDPFACDGALQMACQLAFMAKKKASLPSKIRQATFYQEATDQDVFVHLIFQKMSGLQYVFDAHLFDKNHEQICSLEGVESYFRLSKLTTIMSQG
jgi:hypothetical protein